MISTDSIIIYTLSVVSTNIRWESVNFLNHLIKSVANLIIKIYVDAMKRNVKMPFGGYQSD